MVSRSPIISVRLSQSLKEEVKRRAEAAGETSQDYALVAIRMRMDKEDADGKSETDRTLRT